ncbi:MAG: hypothetical protein H0V29_12045 [Thermoleophilaceae bacterium]|nr:hypothetical protein [Thermoleophilaceae bacterium]
MPTYRASAAFRREFGRLAPEQRRQFLRAVTAFVTDLAQAPPSFSPGLRVKRVQGHSGVWELSFAADGRATFEYGNSVREGEPHVIWRRVGTHAILRNP